MAQMMRPVKQRSGLLATDGKPHPLPDALLAVTVLLGLVSLITAAFPGLHLLTVCTGIVGVVAGGYGQFISVTTRERFGLVLGLGASAIGLFLGLAHSDLTSGFVGG
ncbi:MULTISPECIES: hypothetical protein [Streptomyces]|uniref:Integral membrane protein n=1 Tax=Streptomyces thermoviolaceus subsp. thermoviolaceus TaxID=66860 RepID=A0ABX0YTA9_STRTL|nr:MULTISPECIES: hypothetical protein [Streptomyces]WTD48468.1 hypothetical protein OG899_13575 [Streptomyces thermoviolaceus]NJP15835.1 hypothetical protein [Streptomyces thermoviolaceus subsp. thermoviolaceus]RSS07598.1 hypothetical protein EF917_04510 [Streptomyces sp. WAC00469]GGV72938.1 hypothetical protein GCM10010499_25910 [Streptomyces thermoviolaceus subsp. apingens]GHA88661.1 hypothetical protein GCM10010512_20170 [Streptomyces thermoviolaceus subsp. thermoviolaceus]